MSMSFFNGIDWAAIFERRQLGPMVPPPFNLAAIHTKGSKYSTGGGNPKLNLRDSIIGGNDKNALQDWSFFDEPSLAKAASGVGGVSGVGVSGVGVSGVAMPPKPVPNTTTTNNTTTTTTTSSSNATPNTESTTEMTKTIDSTTTPTVTVAPTVVAVEVQEDQEKPMQSIATEPTLTNNNDATTTDTNTATSDINTDTNTQSPAIAEGV